MPDEPTKPASDHLDQNEIDKILAQSSQAPAGAGGVVTTESPAKKVTPHDFRNPVFLAEAELRRLKLLHEDFARYLSSRLSLHLRMEFVLKLASLTTTSYSKFTDSLPTP